MGTDYHTLAKVTAGEAFKEADKDTNGVPATMSSERGTLSFVFCSSCVCLMFILRAQVLADRHTHTQNQQVQLRRSSELGTLVRDLSNSASEHLSLAE